MKRGSRKVMTREVRIKIEKSTETVGPSSRKHMNYRLAVVEPHRMN